MPPPPTGEQRTGIGRCAGLDGRAELPEPSKRPPLKIGADADETPAADIAAFDATVYA
jgi:hypothetical protein